MNRVNQKEHLDFLKGISDYFSQHTNTKGENICAKHKIEHSGKTVYSIGIDLFLYKKTNNRLYFERALQRAKRIVSLQKEIDGAFIFLPTGREKWNMSNHVIDSGAATDMLATLLLEVGDELSQADYQIIYNAVEKNADTYLVKAAVEKAPTNQRLWGATGLASAYKLTQKTTWRDAMRASVERSLGEFRSDGSIPYVTVYVGHNDPSANDVTTYYHSRHITFMWHVLDSLGEVTEDQKNKLLKATEFLAGMYQRNYVKNLSLETKHWYFLSSYEVASHSYDAGAFMRAYTETKDSQFHALAQGSLKQLYRHRVRDDNGLNDHIGSGTNFQCPYFWNSHVAWLTRLPEEVFEESDGLSYENASQYQHFTEADLVCIDTEHISCKLRGSKQPRHSRMGAISGGGSLIYFGHKDNNFENILNPNLYDYHAPLNFHMYRSVSIRKMFRFKRHEVRALLFRIVVELRALDFGAAFERLCVLRKEFFAPYNHYSSTFATNIKCKKENDTVTYVGKLTDTEGRSISMPHNLLRSYSWQTKEVVVTEKFLSAPLLLNKISYRIVPAVNNLKIDTNVSYKKTKKAIVFSKGVEYITITYNLGKTI